MDEGESHEKKSQFEWGREGQEFDLLKTIVAFANGQGGTIVIDKVTGRKDRVDSARLDDFVNKYVAPRVGLISSNLSGDRCVISVGKSPFAPHVMSHGATYPVGKDGERRPAFHAGQVYVRHSSKSEPASGEDLHTLIREGVTSLLAALGEAISRVDVSNDSDSGLPIRIVSGGPSLHVSIERSHPYTASDIGDEFGKTGAWIGKAINVLGLRRDVAHCVDVGGYKQPIYRFSELAKEQIRAKLEAVPDFNPYASGGNEARRDAPPRLPAPITGPKTPAGR